MQNTVRRYIYAIGDNSDALKQPESMWTGYRYGFLYLREFFAASEDSLPLQGWAVPSTIYLLGRKFTVLRR